LTFGAPYGTTLPMKTAYTKPFRGLLFNKEKIGDIASCVCPPYDVIDSAAVYSERSPFNAVRLELPMAQGSMDSYTAAKTTMDEWLANRVLIEDKSDTIYIYEQEFAVQGVSHLRRGFIALNKLNEKRILTHEETRKKAKEDRERLIGTLKTFTSLVFGLYEDKEEHLEAILVASQKEKVYDFVDEQSIRNRFYRMTDEVEIARLTALMDERPIYIADGHHRLNVSYRLGLSFIPMYVTNMYAPGIVILPYHRTVKFQTPRPLQELLARMAGEVDVRKAPITGQDPWKAVLKEIAGAPQPTYGLYSREDPSHVYFVTGKPEIFDGDDIPDGLKKLRVNILHAGILKKILHIQDDEFSFTQDAHGAAELARSGEADLVVLLPPTTVEEVKDIADNGLYMPPKSTFFHPKILTGLLFHRYR
jgi:uncharacterized protein (DUF1015 family)